MLAASHNIIATAAAPQQEKAFSQFIWNNLSIPSLMTCLGPCRDAFGPSFPPSSQARFRNLSSKWTYPLWTRCEDFRPRAAVSVLPACTCAAAATCMRVCLTVRGMHCQLVTAWLKLCPLHAVLIVQTSASTSSVQRHIMALSSAELAQPVESTQ